MASGGEGDGEIVGEGAARSAQAGRLFSINSLRLDEYFEAAEGLRVYKVAEGREVGVILGRGQALVSEAILYFHDAEIAEEVSLGGQFIGFQAIAFTGLRQCREVHMGCDVLSADTPEGLRVQGMLVVAGEGADGSGGGVEVTGGVAVVDGEDIAGVEGLG